MRRITNDDIARVEFNATKELHVLMRDRAFMRKHPNLQMYLISLVATDCGRPDIIEQYKDFAARGRRRPKRGKRT